MGLAVWVLFWGQFISLLLGFFFLFIEGSGTSDRDSWELRTDPPQLNTQYPSPSKFLTCSTQCMDESAGNNFPLHVWFYFLKGDVYAFHIIKQLVTYSNFEWEKLRNLISPDVYSMMQTVVKKEEDSSDDLGKFERQILLNSFSSFFQVSHVVWNFIERVSWSWCYVFTCGVGL